MDHLKRIFTEFIRNVCLLPDKHNLDIFYPRINMSRTLSFQRLSDVQKFHLNELYEGYFFKWQDTLWYNIGMSRLPIIKQSSRMLVCGEDLGMVPNCVPPAMNQLNILGLSVQRMPADERKIFVKPWQNEYLSVCTPSSHDTSTLREWWEEDKEKTDIFYREILNEHQGRTPNYCETWIVRRIIEQHLESPSMWAIFPIQEFFALFQDLRVNDPKLERINQPSNPEHYWRYRIHMNINDLMNHPQFVEEIRDLISNSRRLV